MNNMDESELAAQLEAMKDDDDAWGEPTDVPAGRPRSERRQRGSVVSVRLTLDEVAKVQAYADHRDLSLSGALRTATLEAAALAAKVVTHTRWKSPSASNANSANDQSLVRDFQSNYTPPLIPSAG